PSRASRSGAGEAGAFATLAGVVATGARVEFTTGKWRQSPPRAWAPLTLRPSPGSTERGARMSTSPTTAQTPLLIPDELKPADGRFGCGPSKVRPEAIA